MRLACMLLLLLSPASIARAQQGPLELKQVLESVERNYPPLLQALLDRPLAEADYLAAQGRFDLTLKSYVDTNSLGYYESRRWDTGVEQYTPYGGFSWFSGYQLSRGTFPSYEGKYLTDTAGEYRTGVRIPLFRDREIDPRRADLWKANLGRKIASLGIDQQRILVRQAATRRYWDWVAAGRRYSVAQSILEIAVARDRLLREGVQAGQLPAIEVTDNERIVQQRRSQLVLAERAVEQAAIELSLYYRDAAGEPVMVGRDRLPAEFPAPAAMDDSRVKDDIDTALKRRPEIARLEAQRQQVDIDSKLARNRRLPGIDAVVSYERDMGERRALRGPDEVRGGVVFDLPLQRRTATGQARAAETRLAQFDQRLRYLRDQVTAEVQDAVSAVRAAYRNTQAVSDELQSTRNMEEAERTRYQLGDSTLFVLNLREIQTVDAAFRQVAAYADYYRALAQYELAIAGGLGNAPQP